MKAEQKQTVVYDDLTLEGMTQEQLDDIEDNRVRDIKAGIIPDQTIGGELVLKIDKGVNLTTVNGKDKFAFNFLVPRYSDQGKLLPQPDAVQMKMMDLETGKFKTKVRLVIPNHNMFLYQEIIKIKTYKVREDENNFKLADKTYIGCI